MKTPALALAIMVALTGCAVGAEGQAHHLEMQVEVGVLATPEDGSLTTDSDAIALSVYLVRDNRLVHVTREHATQDSSALDSVVMSAIAGPTPAEARSGIWSAIPPGTSLLATHLNDGVAEIDLSSEFAAIGGTDEILAVAQIVWSVTALADVDAVLILLDGTPASVPSPDGVLVSEPLDEDVYRELVSQ